MDKTPKTSVLALAKRADLSDSCGALLYMAALMEPDAKTSAPDSEEERVTWDGHMQGLLSALHCVAMHERGHAPEAAAELVDSLLDEARHILGESTSGNRG